MTSSSESKWRGNRTEGTSPLYTEDSLRNGDSAAGIMVEAREVGGGGGGGEFATAVGEHVELGNDGMSEISSSDLSLPEVCVSTNNGCFEDDMTYEVQQAYRIFTGFLLDKYKGITGSFLLPIGHLEAQRGVGGVGGPGRSQLRQSMCLQRMEEKFVGQQYESITEFVADFRLMLENCYRCHGVDHWLSKQAQKLEVMLEQKLTLLSRTLREKTTLAVTSKGRFGAEEERSAAAAAGGTSTRRRSAPRSLTTITVGGHESHMVQALRQEELQRAKDERRQRELDKKEAEETSAKEVEEWEQGLLSQASPHPVDTLWELPAVGHFLCLAQTALNLPEIVFFELERSLLMPRCSLFLAKVMTSLLCPPQKRPAAHRQPPLPYRRWERELRQHVLAWYRATGSSSDQPGRAQQLGLCHQFFGVLGVSSPLEDLPFHLLPFYQRLWLLKGLCDHVYETQKEVQDAVLAQPIHECRESILGYDGADNAYIHFPHFCGADLRIYFQSPCAPPAFPFPPLLARKVEVRPGVGHGGPVHATDGEEWKGGGCYGVATVTGDFEEEEDAKEEKSAHFKRENGGIEETHERLTMSSLKEAGSDSGSAEDSQKGAESKSMSGACANAARSRLKHGEQVSRKQNSGRRSKRVKREPGSPCDSGRAIEAAAHEPCLSVGEHCYTGRSPVRSMDLASPARAVEPRAQGAGVCPACSKSVKPGCRCSALTPSSSASSSSSSSSDSTMHSRDRETPDSTAGPRKRKRKRGWGQRTGTREQRRLRCSERPRFCPTRSAKTATERAEPAVQRKGRKSRAKAGKKLETSSNEIKQEPLAQSPFKLVCSSIQDLRGLISRTEDQLDALQSSKKKSGRWYVKKESVKDLHVTLIRLLKELSPWEPKLVKAFQRNRLRMKKECDDFRKHPDYSNFVREECVSSSSSSSSSSPDHEDVSSVRVGCRLSDHYRGTEEDDVEHAVPQGFWTRGNSTQRGTESGGVLTTYTIPGLQRPSPPGNPDEDLNLCRSSALKVESCPTSPVNTGVELRSEPGSTRARPRDLNPAPTSPRDRVPILHPTIGLPWGYTPIPTLFAKSVGNKVTLMKRPADPLGPGGAAAKTRGGAEPAPHSLLTPTRPPAPQKPHPHPHPTAQPTPTEASDQKKTVKQLVVSVATASLANPPPAKQPQTAVPNSPVKAAYRPLDQVLRPDGTGQVKVTVQPLLDQKTGEKIIRQVVNLPSKLLLQNNIEVPFRHQPQPPRNVQGPVSKTSGPLCSSTNVAGFSIPEGRIPVQQVAPLNQTRSPKTPSPSAASFLQPNTVTATNRKVAQVCSLQSATQIHTPTATPSSALSNTDGTKGPKQELKTVCIRDSQSILVTTRGGNTGIVKVQTLADQSAHGSSPASPVITISPQFKAFLVSKGCSPASSLSSSPSVSVAVPAPPGSAPAQSPFVSKSPLTGAAPLFTTASSHTSPAGLPVTMGNSFSPASILPTQGQPAVNAQTHLVKSNLMAPSLRSITANVPAKNTPACRPGPTLPGVEERPQLTKFILVSPSSTGTSSSAALPKVTSPIASPPPGSRFLLIGEPVTAPASSTATYMGGVPRQGPVPGVGPPPVPASSPGDGLRMALAPGLCLGNLKPESSSRLQNITLPTGLQMNQMKPLGQTIHTMLQSSPQSSPAISSTGHILMKTSSLVSGGPVPSGVTRSSLPQRTSSVAVPDRETPRSAVTTSTGFIVANDPAPNLSVPSLSKPSLGTLNVHPGSVSAANQPARPVKSPVASSPHPVIPSTPPSLCVPHQTSTSTPNSTSNSINTKVSPVTRPTPCTTSTAAASGPVQQRIVINTSTHLVAGTQILLNNARFVVPPQGLGPGSHVLIISGQAPPQAPANGSFTSPLAPAPPAGPRPVSATPRSSTTLPVSPRPRVTGAPPPRSPVGSPALTTVPNAAPVRLVGARSLSSSLMSNVANLVSQMRGGPGLPSPGPGTSPLAAPSALVCPTNTSTLSLGSAQQLSAGATQPAPFVSTIPPSHGTHSPTRTTLPLTSPLSASTTTVSLPGASPGPIASVTSVVAQSPAGIPLLASTATAEVSQCAAALGSQGHPGASSAASTVPQAMLQTSPNPLQTGPNPAVKPQPTAVQPQPPGPRTPAVPAVAVSPIVSTVPRIQS